MADIYANSQPPPRPDSRSVVGYDSRSLFWPGAYVK